MNRETRDKLTSATGSLTTGNACWETPPEVYAKLHEQFAFDLDLTADPARHCSDRWLGPGSVLAEDALTASWALLGTSGYSNPPYGPFVPRMLAKAKGEAALGFSTTLLLPLRVTRAFRQDVLVGASDLLFCDRRITFYEYGHPRWNAKKLAAGKHVADPALFDSIVVRYTPDWRSSPRVGVWGVPVHVFQPREGGGMTVSTLSDHPGCLACAVQPCSVHRAGLGTACVRCSGSGLVSARTDAGVETGRQTTCDTCAGVGLIDRSLPRIVREKVATESAAGFLAE